MSDKSRGQRSHKCEQPGCKEMGRKLASFGGQSPIYYCPYHRKKYGERVIDAMVNARFNYKLSNFLSDIKANIFMDDSLLCCACGSAIGSYIRWKTVELEEILEYAKLNEIESTSGSELE